MDSEERLRYAREIVGDEPDEAMRICNDVLSEHFSDDMGQKALFMAAYIMMEAERYGLAYHLYRRCSYLRPDISEIWSNMGMCLEEYSPAQAMECFEKALEREPGNAHALANRGLMKLQTGNPIGCVTDSKLALKIDPSLMSARHNMSLGQLMLRDWAKGWANYHGTLGVKHREGRDYGLPEWNGEPGEVVVYGEQGVGDEIMFATCLEEMAKTNAIILDCDKRLEGLFKRTFDFPVYGTRFKRETPLMDNHAPQYQCAIGQLPSRYRNTAESFPGKPFLKVDPERALMWRALFDTFKGRKIGVAWRGGLKNTKEVARSFTLDDLEPIFNDTDTFISLEYKPVDDQDLERFGIKSYSATRAGGDIDDLAALVSQLDYVVCPCTTVVYIAGGLGIDCDVLVPSEPGYRYHIEGQFPWFNSVRLVRQLKGENWSQTIQRTKSALGVEFKERAA